MTTKTTTTRIARLAIAGVGLLLVAGVLLVVQQAHARGRGRGSVRGSSRSRARRPAKRPSTPARRPSAPTRRPGTPARRPAGRRSYRADKRYKAPKDARRDYHRHRTVNNLIRLGARLLTRPKCSRTVVVSGTTYYYCGGVYYVRRGTHYVIVSAPPGAVVYSVPTTTTVVHVGSTEYLYHNGAYYVVTSAPASKPPTTEVNVKVTVEGSDGSKEQELPEMVKSKDDEHYKVVAPPVGATVPYIPKEADEEMIGGKKYFVYAGTYYRPFASDGETIYMVVENPKKPTT